MKHVAIVGLLMLSQVLYGQQTETRKVDSFTGVKAAEGIDVYLKKGDKESLKLEVNGVSLDAVLTEVSGGFLKIHMREGRYRDRTVKVYVTYVSIDKLSASSAANIFGQNPIKAKSISLNASSAATIDVQIEAEDVNAGASSAADIELRGKAKTLTIDVSSAGEVDAYELEAEKAEVDASSAGSVKVNITKEISANASSGGSVRYRGNPERSNTNSSSGGSVKKAN